MVVHLALTGFHILFRVLPVREKVVDTRLNLFFGTLAVDVVDSGD